MENLKLNTVRVLEFYLKEPESNSIKNNFVIDDIRIKYTAQFLVNSKNDKFACVLKIDYLYEINGKNESFLNSKIFFEFIDLSLNKEKILNEDFPENFFETIFSLSYSTARGILISKTSNTLFSNVYLPVVDPKKELKNIAKINNPSNKKKNSKEIN